MWVKGMGKLPPPPPLSFSFSSSLFLFNIPELLHQMKNTGHHVAALEIITCVLETVSCRNAAIRLFLCHLAC